MLEHLQNNTLQETGGKKIDIPAAFHCIDYQHRSFKGLLNLHPFGNRTKAIPTAHSGQWDSNLHTSACE